MIYTIYQEFNGLVEKCPDKAEKMLTGTLLSTYSYTQKMFQEMCLALQMIHLNLVVRTLFLLYAIPTNTPISRRIAQPDQSHLYSLPG